jgi:hypothetical protein
MKLLDEVRAEQAKRPGWTFERTWTHLQIVRPEIFVQAHKPLKTRDPRLDKEFATHKGLEDSRTSQSIDLHAERLKKINARMKAQKLDFTTAFSQVCKEENDLKAKPATASVPTRIVPPAEPKVYLVQSIESGRQIDFGPDEVRR